VWEYSRLSCHVSSVSYRIVVGSEGGTDNDGSMPIVVIHGPIPFVVSPTFNATTLFESFISKIVVSPWFKTVQDILFALGSLQRFSCGRLKTQKGSNYRISVKHLRVWLLGADPQYGYSSQSSKGQLARC